MTPAAPGPIHFKPMKGCLSVAQKLFDAFGVGSMWAGEDGFGRRDPAEVGRARSASGADTAYRAECHNTPADGRSLGVYQEGASSSEAQDEWLTAHVNEARPSS